MKAEHARRARVAGIKAVAAYLARLLSCHIGPIGVGLDVFRFTNPYDHPLREHWYGGFDEAVERFRADPGPDATFQERIARETWAARRGMAETRRRTA